MMAEPSLCFEMRPRPAWTGRPARRRSGRAVARRRGSCRSRRRRRLQDRRSRRRQGRRGRGTRSSGCCGCRLRRRRCTEDGARGAGAVGVLAVVHGHLEQGLMAMISTVFTRCSLVYLAGAVNVGTIVVAVGGAAAEGDGQAEKADHEEFLLGHGFVLVLGRKNGHFGLIFRSVHILTIHHCGCGGRMRLSKQDVTHPSQAGCSGCRKSRRSLRNLRLCGASRALIRRTRGRCGGGWPAGRRRRSGRTWRR